MTRQSSAGFAQFFPTAPRAAREKATEREKARLRTQETAGSLLASQPVVLAAPADGLNGQAAPTDANLVSGSHHQAEDHGSPLGEILTAVGSASSHASTGSSIFSATTRQSLASGLSQNAAASTVTPLTSIESPSVSGHTHPPKPTTSNSQIPDHQQSSTAHHSPAHMPNGSSDSYPAIDRVPARAPGRSRKGVKCIYDPLLDKTLSKDKIRAAKPTFKEFGMDDDDAPPSDPRLAMGGRLNYMNTDFRHHKSRLRPAAYNLKPYPFEPKTSIGPGPPTQIVVMGFNPLINFQKVLQAFATFGDIAESSNKMHPETGSYLGFATFRYRDSQPSRSRPMAIKAIDAARRALRTMNGQRIESNNIKVEYDPNGKKSGRMLEETVNRDRSTPNPSNVRPPPAGPRTTAPEPAHGPPPMAPRGPAAHRQTATPMPTGPGRPIQPIKQHSVVEDKPIAPQLAGEPYIFVPSAKVPVMHTTVPHMKKRLKAHSFDDIRVDRTGYYIVFPSSSLGRSEAERCFRNVHRTEFFNYEFYMTLCLPPLMDDKTETTAHAPRRRTPSPDRKRKQEVRNREDNDRRRQEEKNDLEEEKRQRAKNFDPVQAAREVISHELAEHLIKHIRTRVAAPALTAFLDPKNHIARRRQLNLEDPIESTPSRKTATGNESPQVGTPNSGADPIEKRTGRLEISALPRIRKIKNPGQAQQRNYGFTDPFARKRPPQARNAFRSLHHRLKSYDSDVESDDEGRRSVARETEEPESRPRSRMSTDDEDDEASKDELGSWGAAEEDSMTEASFAVGTLPTKKRKLELEAQTALKRQKKSDEELFGVTLDHIETGLPVHPVSEGVTPECDLPGGKEESLSRSETPSLLAGKLLSKKIKSKRKSKKQLFEEREALKKHQSDIEGSEAPEDRETPAAEDPKKSEPVEEEEAYQPAAVPTDLSLFAYEPTKALQLSQDSSASLGPLQDVEFSPADLPNFAKLQKRFPVADFDDPLLWLWRRNRVREVNNLDQSAEKSLAIEGYYVPNPTGCARTEPIKKILNSEKSKYLPHHIKVQKAREAREARVQKDGKTAPTTAPAPAPTKGNSRANRANNRRHVTALQDEMKSSGDPDVFKFNQLKKRKKPVKFARSAIHNWGLYTEENINKDDMIIEYVGEQVRQQISEIREVRYLKQGMGSSYLFRIDENTVIDATKKGGIARFINHSCMPNCTAKIIKVDGSKRIVIYALRDIARSKSNPPRSTLGILVC
ncbi:histone methyltransferase set1 [Verticillium nonalfalfae]|uniref:Histone-lysine N-methyltransferase, H3 lysine-4 specific n=1 Tax=Verticillium nonalfalfae TaxID=1051616 RepID=A0A3M9Y1T9_9PEZI|nr:histone methyltransferase set1 [Verticillium nonalfalfae]RNJ54012.1 histone methyltransferase set1 [Verticillium nonalfalfae]